MKINNMRTLQEKYNAIQEGKFSKDQFLVEARMQHPNIITRFNGYDDTIQILKNRGMISEVKIEEARLTKNSLTDYRYKPTNDMDKYPYEQILRGLRVELEGMQVQGTPTPEEYKKALTKVLKNLEKDEIFYTNQLAGRNKKVDLHDKMVDATAKNTVDTYNGMKKVKDLKEAHVVRPNGSIKTSTDKTNNKPGYTVKPGGSIKKEDHTKNPNDKYVVKFSKANNTYQVWEGDHLVTDFATEEKAKAYADRENKKQDLTEKVLKEGIKNLIKKVLKEEDLERAERGAGNPYGTEEEYELFNSPEEGKSDAEYKRELENYLEDNQIYGYTDMLFDILTAPDEEQVADNLADFLDDHQIYGYNKGLLAIFRDYANRDQSEDEWDEADYERMSNSLKEEEIEEATDTEADKNMVRKFMTMYETEPSKFEKLHKQAQVQAKTTKDIKFKHLLSLLDRAKAGALQSLSNQDKFEADREGMEEGYNEDKIAKFEKYTYTLDGKVVKPEIAFFDHILGAELDGKVYKIGIPDETGTVELRSHKGKTGMYTEDVFESVSLKDLLD